MRSSFCLGRINRNNALSCRPRFAGMDSFNRWIPAFAEMTTIMLRRLFGHADLYATGWSDDMER